MVRDTWSSSDRHRHTIPFDISGNYPRSSIGSILSLEIRSSQIRDSVVSSISSGSRSIRITESLIDNSALKPAGAYDGIQVTKSNLRNVTISYRSYSQESKLEMINCTINNITALLIDSYYYRAELMIRNSVVHNFSIFVSIFFSGPNVTLIESTLNNVLIAEAPRWMNPDNWGRHWPKFHLYWWLESE